MVNSQTVVFVCNGKSCSLDGAAKIIAYLHQKSNNEVKIKTKFCFGKCGNGPILVVLPVEKWFYKTDLEKVNSLLEIL